MNLASPRTILLPKLPSLNLTEGLRHHRDIHTALLLIQELTSQQMAPHGHGPVLLDVAHLIMFCIILKRLD